MNKYFSCFKLFQQNCNPEEYVAAQYKNEVLLHMESWEIIGIMESIRKF